MTFPVTVCNRSDGNPVGKTAKKVKGGIEVTAESPKHPDRFEVHQLETTRDLRDLVGGLVPNQLIVAGVPANGSATGTIGTKDHLSGSDLPLTDSAFQWPEGTGIMVLDHDIKADDEGGRAELRLPIEGFPSAIDETLFPDDDDQRSLMTAYARWPSSSSCVRDTKSGADVTGMRGHHHALLVEDAGDIPRAGDVLVKRLVLAGKGYAFVDATGSPHIRTIVDSAVWRPSHKIFAGGAAMGKGLEQERAPFIASVAGDPVDTRALLPDLTEDEGEQYDAACERLIEDARPLMTSRREVHRVARIAGRAESIARRRGVPLAIARAEAAKQVEEELSSCTRDASGYVYRLSGDAEIETSEGLVTVDDILADRGHWHRMSCADPLEPEYGGGIGKAIIFTDGTPNISSRAHGGGVYFLKQSASADFEGLDDDAAPSQSNSATPASPAAPPRQPDTAANEVDAAQDAPVAPDASQTADASAPSRPGSTNGIRNAADLLTRVFPPIAWIVEGLLPRGCYLLGGRPKVGKSWFILALLLAVSRDTEFIGCKVDPSDCLYLALEDTDRRMQDRIRRLIGDFAAPEELAGLRYHTAWERGEDGVKKLKQYLRENPSVKVVVIDTLARVKPAAARNTNAYESDYAALAPYQSISARHGVTVILVTHTKKAPSEDSFDDITGSLGQAASVDGMMVLERYKGGKGQLLLRCRGRDLDGDRELVLERDKSGHFFSHGEPSEVGQDANRKEVIDHLQDLGDVGDTATGVAKALGRKSVGSTRNLLERMAQAGTLARRDKRYYLEPAIGDWEEDVPGHVSPPVRRPAAPHISV